MMVQLDWPHWIAHPPKPPVKRKDFANNFYARPVIAHFVSNFVAMVNCY